MIDLKGVWAGLSYEVGGEIGFGTQSQNGLLVSVGDACATRNPRKIRFLTYEQMAISLGVGLGGSTGANFVVAYNVKEPLSLVNVGDSPQFDWSLDLVLNGISRYVRNLPEMVELIAIGRKFDSNLLTLAGHLANYENDVKMVKTVAENVVKNATNVIAAANGEPSMLSFPLFGTGLRISARMKLEVTNITKWGPLLS